MHDRHVFTLIHAFHEKSCDPLHIPKLCFVILTKAVSIIENHIKQTNFCHLSLMNSLANLESQLNICGRQLFDLDSVIKKQTAARIQFNAEKVPSDVAEVTGKCEIETKKLM